jgi:hypothetical protein
MISALFFMSALSLAASTSGHALGHNLPKRAAGSVSTTTLTAPYTINTGLSPGTYSTKS